jgi:Predicted membrane protein/domain
MKAMEPVADQINIDTPELVSIEMPLAGIGSRFIAIFIDYAIWTVLLVLVSLVGAIVLPGISFLDRLSVNWAIGILVVLFFLFHWGYFTLFEALWNGRTPGKRLVRIHVIHRTGRAINFLESLTRNLIRFVDSLPSLYAVGLITMFLSRQNQRLGDMAAGTLVVRDQIIEQPYWGEMSSRTITAGSFADIHASESRTAPHLLVQLPASLVAKLSTSDLEVLEGFFTRRLDMDLSTRASLAKRIATAITTKSSLEIPEGISIETFLEAVAHQLREVGTMRS